MESSRVRFLTAVVVVALVPIGAGLFVALRPAPVAIAPEVVAPEVLDAGVAPAPVEAPRLALTRLAGVVEVRRGGGVPVNVEGAGWLDAADEIAVGDGGEATLELPGRYRIHLQAGARFSVTELTRGVDRFLLQEGLARAETEPGARLAVAVAGSDVVAEAGGADASAFALSSNGAGTVAAAATRGEVRVTTARGAVLVKAGERTLVRPGEAPQAPRPIPASLLLKVAWPTEATTRRKELTVTGTTEPGAVVAIAGRTVRVEADGRFATVVLLREGENRVPVEADDPSGLKARDAGPIVRLQTRGAAAAVETKGLWDEPRPASP